MISKRHQFALMQYSPGFTYANRQELHYRYLLLAAQEFAETYKALYRSSRPTSPLPKQEFEFSEAFDVDVFVKPSTAGGLHIVCSFGVLLALDDFFMRLVCNDAFFAADEKARRWRSCSCHWLTDYGFQPRARYEDYEEDEVSLNIDKVRASLFGPSSYINPVSGLKGMARFFSGLPINDAERVALAQFMFEVAFLWIVLHEESHYYRGHLHYQKTLNKSTTLTERDKSKLLSADTNKVFEWQADDLATAGAIDVILKKTNLDRLPKYCRGKKIWLLRLVQVSIGCVLLIVHKSRRRDGIESHYPSVPTRLGSIFVSSHKHLCFGNDREDRLPFTLAELQLSWAGALLDIYQAEGLVPGMQPLESDGHGGKRPAMSKDHLGLWAESWEMFALGFALGTGWDLRSPQELRFHLGDTIRQLRSPETAKDFYEKWLRELNEILDAHPTVFNELAPYRRQARPV